MPARLRKLAALSGCALVLTLPALAQTGSALPPTNGTAGAAAAADQALSLGGWGAGLLPAIKRADARTAADAGQAAAASPAPVKSAVSASKKAATQRAKTSAKTAARSAAKVAKPKAGAARSAARPGTAARVSPGWVTLGHYIRSLTGRGADVHAMYALGAQDAARNPGGMQHLVLLDIGGQVPHGVHLSTTNRFISYQALVRAMNAYVNGYQSHDHSGATVTIAIGTNNDLSVSRAEGRAWARQVVEPVRAYATHFHQVVVAGANDIEPGFRAGPVETHEWLVGYLTGTNAPFVFNGSADGCSAVHSSSHCNGAWTSQQLARFAGAMAPARTIVLPQIYNGTMAAQWAQLARAAKAGHHPLHIVGPLTENSACGGDPSCPTMPSSQAFRGLMANLHQVHAAPSSLPYQVDLDIR